MNNIITRLVGQNDTVKPTMLFDGVVGQNTVIQKLQFYLNSHSIATPIPNMLFTGSHGLGKTFIAGKLAQNMHRRFVEVNASTIRDVKEFVDEILFGKVMGETPVTVLLDEAHGLSADIVRFLLTLLAPNAKNSCLIDYKGEEIEYDMTKINMILATTDAYLIFTPLLNRLERVCFQPYGLAEMKIMLKLYLPDIKIQCDSDGLAEACRGRGRDAYQLAQKIKRHCNSQKIDYIDSQGWNYLKDIFEIYPLGLNKQEIDVLKLSNHSGPISCSNLAMVLMVNEENIENEMEVRLRELNLISNTSQGRILTADGKKYIQTYCKE